MRASRLLSGAVLVFVAALPVVPAARGPAASAASAASDSSASIEGSVFDSIGRPVAGALVAAVHETLDNSEAASKPASSTRTSSDGEFLLVGLPPGAYSVTATRVGLTAAIASGTRVAAGEARRDVRLTMSSGGATLSGVLRGFDRRPLASVLVRAIRYSDDLGDVFYAESDESGSYSMTLPDARYLLLVVADGHETEARNVQGDRDQALDFDLYRPSAPGPAPSEVVDWIRGHAIPLRSPEAGQGFADMESLRTVIGDAHLVALGEATHGTREFFQMKHRMLEFLVERMGFTVFGIEATMPEAFDVNEYVLAGKGDPAKALAGLYFWTWNTEEVLAMIRWMRAYNADSRHKKKVKFYGFDMQSAPRAVREVLAYLRRVDPKAAEETAARLAVLGDPFRDQRFERRSQAAKDSVEAAVGALLRRFDDRKKDYVRRSNGKEWAVARQHVRILSQNMESRKGNFEVRDRAMAENILWILDHEGPGTKMVAWAHNGHVSVSEDRGFRFMGGHLRRKLGDDMVVLGFAFHQGEFQAMNLGGRGGLRGFAVGPAPEGSLDATLASAGVATGVLDLRRRPAAGPIADWFSTRHKTRTIGAVYSDSAAERYFLPIAAPRHFDALVFFERTTAARANDTGTRPPGPAIEGAVDLGFEEGKPGEIPAGWTVPHASRGIAYRTEVAAGSAHSGKQFVQIRRQPGPRYGEWYGTVSRREDAEKYVGKKLRLKAAVRVDARAPEDRAYLWLRVSRAGGGPAAEVFYDGMEERPIRGAVWREYRIDGEVPAGAASIEYGLAFVGEGSALLDDVSLEAAATEP